MADQEFKLIDGTFSAEEAEKMLMTLFNYKIEYHSRDDFSKYIRFNRDPKHSNTRIEELNQTKAGLAELLSQSKKDDRSLVINSVITIRLK